MPGPILPPSGASVYASIEDVLNLVRALLNDTQAGATNTPGEGRIFTDSAPFVMPLLNASIGELQRRLQNKSVTTKIADVFIFNVPPINSASGGVGAPNPATYQVLSYTGFFDGETSTPSPFLPPDLIVPITLKQRQSGTGLQFTDVPIAEEGLPSINQNTSLGQWEWRGDAIYWNGCTEVQDIELRYQQAPQFYAYALSPTLFPKTTIPIRDGVEALAYLIVEKFAQSRLPPGGANPWTPKSDAIIQDLANRYTRSRQNKVYYRDGFGDDSGGYGGSWL